MSNNTLKIKAKHTDSTIFEENIETQIQNLIKEAKSSLQEYIIDQLSNKDGGPTISNYKVKNIKYNSTQFVGSFRLQFQIDRRYCCSDVEACSNDYLDFAFELKNNELIAQTNYFDWTLSN